MGDWSYNFTDEPPKLEACSEVVRVGILQGAYIHRVADKTGPLNQSLPNCWHCLLLVIHYKLFVTSRELQIATYLSHRQSPSQAGVEIECNAQIHVYEAVCLVSART